MVGITFAKRRVYVFILKIYQLTPPPFSDHWHSFNTIDLKGINSNF